MLAVFCFLFDVTETATFVRVQIIRSAFCLASLTATILKITLNMVLYSSSLSQHLVIFQLKNNSKEVPEGIQSPSQYFISFGIFLF